MIVIQHSDDDRIPARSTLISINDQPIDDFLEYEFYNDTQVRRHMLIENNGKKQLVMIGPHEEISIDIESPQYRTCENDCSFCFIKGLPPGLRKELYFKDDDYRLSFLFGNFISLTNVYESDIARIGRLRLTPLYVSVHTTNAPLRNQLFANDRAGMIMEQLKALVDNNITLHCQIVVIPGMNDKAELEHSIKELSSLYPGVASIGIVPVGHTRFMAQLPLLSSDQAQAIISHVADQQQIFRKRYNTGFVYAADEIYARTCMPIPPLGYYDDFPQIENGIGMVRSFMHEIEQINTKKPLKGRILFVTSRDGEESIVTLQQRFATLGLIAPENIDHIVVDNSFLGESITVSGLMAAQDINATLTSCLDHYDRIVLPPNCTNERGQFLDNGYTYDKVSVAPPTLQELTQCLQL